MNRKLLIGLTVVATIIMLQACARKLDPEASCNFVQSSELQRVSWKGNLPVKLMVHNSVPEQAYKSIERAVEHWNNHPQVSGVTGKLFEVEVWGVGGSAQPARDGYNIIYWMNTWELEKMSEQARTTIHWTGSRIYEADIRVNDSDLGPTFYMGEGEDVIGVDVESLFIHELGHVLGLAHNSDSSSVMQEQLAHGDPRREIGETDLNSVLCEYK